MRTIRSYIKKQDKRKLALYLNAHMAVSRYRIITQDQLSHFVQNTWKKKKKKNFVIADRSQLPLLRARDIVLNSKSL